MRLLLVSLAACGAAKPVPEPQCNADAEIVLRGQDDVAAAARCLTIASLTIRTGMELDLTPLKKLHVIPKCLPSKSLSTAQVEKVKLCRRSRRLPQRASR